MGPNIGVNLQHDNFSIGNDFGRAFFQCRSNCCNRLYNATLGNAICLDFIKRNPKPTTAIWSRTGSIRFIFLNGARFQRFTLCIFRGDLHTCRCSLFRPRHGLDEAKEMAEQSDCYRRMAVSFRFLARYSLLVFSRRGNKLERANTRYLDKFVVPHFNSERSCLFCLV